MTRQAEDERQTLTYRGRLLDVGRFKARHPGGAGFLERFLGTDATVAIHMAHDVRKPAVASMLRKLDCGPDPERPLTAFDADYLALEAELMERGWFTPDPRWYAMKMAAVFAWLVAAILAPGPWLTGILFGLFIQQSAFIAHDTCHDAVVPRRFRRFTAWLFGTVCFGLNHDKWTREHNLHHMINSRPLEDPQLNNLPDLLYASRELAMFEQQKRALTQGEKAMMGYQHLWILPALLLYGRINVLRIDITDGIRNRDWEYFAGLFLHLGLWATMLWLGRDQPGFAWIFIPVTLAVSGLIHLQLILSHAYRPRLTKAEQEATGMKLQIISNQNVTTAWWNDWFHGGLQDHIEHHLFPRLPRHSLAKVRPLVRELCRKHNLPYRSDPFLPATWELMKSLHRQGAPLRAELAAARAGGADRQEA